MQLIPFETSLGMTKDEKNAKLAPARVKSARMKAELEVAKLEEEIASIETEVTEAASRPDFTLAAIGLPLDRLDLANRRLKQYQEIVSQLFPAAPTA